MDGLTAMLAEDVEYWADGGGKVSAATRVIVGMERVVKVLLGLTRLVPDDFYVELVEINGMPGFLYYGDGALMGVSSIDVVEGKITAIRQIRNPDKLQSVLRQ